MAYSVVGAFRDCLRDRRGPAANADCGVPRQPGPVRSPSPSTGHADPGLDQPARGPTPNELNTRVPVDLTDSDVSGSAPSAPTLTGRTSNDAAGFASCCGPSSCSPRRAFDTGLRPGPFPTRAASLLPGLLTATRTGLTPASDDEHEQQITPSRGHLPFHWAHARSRIAPSSVPQQTCLL